MALRVFCVIGFLSVLFAPRALAENGFASLPLSHLYNKYDKFLELPEEASRYLSPRYKLRSKLVEPGTVKLSFVFENETHLVEVDKDGYLMSYPSKAMLAADPTVYTDQPKGSMALTLTIGFKMEEALEYDARLLHERVHNAFKAAKSLGGFMAVFAPSHKNIKLAFSTSCHMPRATYEVDGTAIDLMHSAEGYATIPFEKDKKMRKKGKLKFSCQPTFAELG